MPGDVSALQLVLTSDPALVAIVRLSLMSLYAAFFAALIGMPLEASKGDLPLAVGLGMVLIGIVIAVNALAWTARRAGERFAA